MASPVLHHSHFITCTCAILQVSSSFPPPSSSGNVQLSLRQKLNPSQVEAIYRAERNVLPRAQLPCSSNQLDASRLLQPEVLPTQSIDFAAIADSSVGGGGLPRPYGRFSAARNGDGTAIWERLPQDKKAAGNLEVRAFIAHRVNIQYITDN